ncbi:MAG: copper transport protein [Chloroflexota bacterium]|jgi:copper transport protein|nr:copper transport protein [Chloroflexota bacterium]
MHTSFGRHWLPAMVVAAVASVTILVSGPQLALAHAHYDHADPAPGAALDSSPSTVTIWYVEGLQADQSWIQVLDSNGHRVDMNDSTVIGDDNSGMTVSLQPELPSGLYLVSWQNLSEDGDGLTGRFTFGVGMTPPNGGSPSEADMAP